MKKYLEYLDHNTYIVGVIGSVADLTSVIAKGINTNADLYEWRADMLAPEHVSREQLLSIKKPLILTVRDRSERGMNKDLCAKDRKGIYLEYMSFATFVDIETSTMEGKEMRIVTAKARKDGVGIIASHHSFEKKTGGGAVALSQANYIATRLHADMLKLAVYVDDPNNLAYFISNVAKLRCKSSIPISAMTMGPFGKVSRLLFAIAYGSPFVYGSVGSPHVMGQIEVANLWRMLCMAS